MDFPDEGDVPAAVAARAGPEIAGLLAELEAYRTRSSAAQAIRDGVQIAFWGRPNAGKSSLLNQLAGSEMAIVSETPGTTRDVIEVKLDLGGVPVILADTAGLRNQTTDDIEREGMRRAIARAEAAHLRIMVIDPLTDDSIEGMLEGADLLHGDFLVYNKSDIWPGDLKPVVPKNININKAVEEFHLSAQTGTGIPAFLEKLTETATKLTDVGGSAALTRARHVRAVDEAMVLLHRAQTNIGETPELAGGRCADGRARPRRHYRRRGC